MTRAFPLILVAVGLAFFAGSATAFDEVRVTTNFSMQTNPAVSGDHIVWEDYRWGWTNRDIYMYDVASAVERQITTNEKNQVEPAVSGNRIVWQDSRNTIIGGFQIFNEEIYLYDLTSEAESRFSNRGQDELKAAISGDWVVWQDGLWQNGGGSPFSMNIYARQVGAGSAVAVCTAASKQTSPAIWGTRVAWLDERNGWPNIYMYDRAMLTETPITDSSMPKEAPDICGNHIVWAQFTGTGWDIMVHDISAAVTTQLEEPGDQTSPAVSDVGIVWVDKRTDLQGDLYFYDFAQAAVVPLVVNMYAQAMPDIDGSRVVWADMRNGNYDIYYLDYAVPTGADLEIKKSSQPQAVEVGDYLVYTVDVRNLGPSAATGVTVVDTLSSKVEYISSSCSRGAAHLEGSAVIWGVGDLDVQYTARLTVLVKATVAGRITNTAVVDGNEDDHMAGNNTATVTTRCSTFEKKGFGGGWAPSIDADAAGNAHMSFTADGQMIIEHPLDPAYGYPICHAYDDIVYATNRSGRWQREIVFDGTGHPSPPNVANPPYYYEQALESAVALDAEGFVHLAYVVDDVMLDVNSNVLREAHRLEYVHNRGGRWCHARVLAEVTVVESGNWSTNGIRSLHVAADAQGKAHIIFIDKRSFVQVGRLSYITNSSGDWQTQVLGEVYGDAALAIDGDGHVHLGYYSWDIVPGGDFYQGMAYRTNSPDGAWQTPEPVETNWTGGQKEGLWCDIAVDALSRPHVSYVSGQGEAREDYRHAVRDGGVWQTSLVATGEFQSGPNRIGVAPAGDAHILYQDRSTWELVYATSTSGDWVTEAIGPAVSWGWVADIAVDAANGAHIAYDDSFQGTLSYLGRPGPDADSDGISDAFERGPDGSNPAYDGNGDGTADAEQDNVASFFSFGQGAYVTVATSDGTLTNVAAQENPAPADAPGDMGFVYDFIGFMLMDLPIGGSATVTLYLPEGATPTAYYKYGPTHVDPEPHWYEFMYDGQTGAQIGGNVVTLHFEDGQRGDNDLTSNGIIVDPGGPAVYAPCIIDMEDLRRFVDEWLLTPPTPGLTTDYDGDGSVTLADLAIIADNWLGPCPAP